VHPAVVLADLLEAEAFRELATSAPPADDRRFSSGAFVTARSNSGRGLGPTDVAKIQPRA